MFVVGRLRVRQAGTDTERTHPADRRPTERAGEYDSA